MSSDSQENHERSTSLSPGEYWLLETAIVGWIPLPFLTPRDIEVLFNKPGHGLSKADVASTLHALADRGYVEIRDSHQECLVHFSVAEIERQLIPPPRPPRPSPRYCYRLTALGGTCWERASNADWSRFVRAEWREKEDRLLVAAAPSFLRRYAEIFRDTIAEDGLSITEERWDVVRPWQPTYWKTLPEGNSLRIKSTKAATTSKQKNALRRLQPLMKWYDSPFESDGQKS